MKKVSARSSKRTKRWARHEEMKIAPHGGDHLSLPERYEVEGLIGRGGMAEVFGVRDRILNRTVALKLILPEISETVGRPRFIEEVKVTAQLEHPGIVPIYDFGFAGDRAYYTMKHIRGEPWSEVLSRIDRRNPLELRRAITILASVCDAIAYAHARGVTHRDIKPSNVMLGAFREVVVLDWGLAKARAASQQAVSDSIVSSISPDAQSQYGSITGTVAYMSPEQAAGAIDRVGPPADVYALGAVLWEILAGAPPFGLSASPGEILHALTAGRVPAHLPAGTNAPEELALIALSTTRPDIEERPADAGVVAVQLRAWLDGEQTRDRALSIVAEAQERLRRAGALRAAADQALERFDRESRSLHPLAPLEEKREVWALEDERQERSREAEQLDVALTEQLESALRLIPDMPEAHKVLAEHYRSLHERAEATDDAPGALRLGRLLERHDRAKEHASYLAGRGALTLHTDPPAAEATLFRFEEHDRCLLPVRIQSLGHTPIIERPLDMGSYLVELAYPGRLTVRYPVEIRRLEHWDGCPPSSSEPLAIPLPCQTDLGDGEVYVPPGWARLGGDARATHSLSARRLWIDGFAIDRLPLTCEDYVAYLNRLFEAGEEQAAIDAWPALSYWEAKVPEEFRNDQWIDRDANGRFYLRRGHPRWPVTLVNWAQASAFATDRARRERRPWRLPAEMEWEKAARGVDGRYFPWGNRFDAGMALTRKVREAEDGRGLKCCVDDFPGDVSLYGVCGMAGNVRDWCQDAGHAEGPAIIDARPVLSNGEDLRGPGRNGMHRIHKGGCWNAGIESSRAAFRDGPPFIYSDPTLGFRCARPWPADSSD
jgi:serine/threonine-protein kinase